MRERFCRTIDARFSRFSTQNRCWSVESWLRAAHLLINNECGILLPPHEAVALGRGLSAALDRTWGSEGISQLRRRSWEQIAAERFDTCASPLPSTAQVLTLAKFACTF